MHDRFKIIDKVEESQYPDLLELFSNEYWTLDRKIEEFPSLLKNSSVLRGIIDVGSGKLIGFARLLTDFLYVATLYDLVIHPHYRNIGLGQFLLESILHDERLQEVESFELYCLPDLTGYYAQFGFQSSPNGVVFMRKKSE